MPITIRKCDVCGVAFMQDYGYSIAAMWAVTGFHEGVAGYQCTDEQHWGCTPEHAMQAHIACLQHDEHLSVEGLKKRHAEALAQGKMRVEPSLQEHYDKKGEAFHIIDAESLPIIIDSYGKV